MVKKNEIFFAWCIAPHHHIAAEHVTSHFFSYIRIILYIGSYRICMVSCVLWCGKEKKYITGWYLLLPHILFVKTVYCCTWYACLFILRISELVLYMQKLRSEECNMLWVVTWQRLLKHIQQIIIVQRTFVNDVFPQKKCKSSQCRLCGQWNNNWDHILWESFLDKDDSIVNN